MRPEVLFPENHLRAIDRGPLWRGMWMEITETEIGWIAGFLEGEGCFLGRWCRNYRKHKGEYREYARYFRPRIEAVQAVPEDPLFKLKDLAGGSVYNRTPSKTLKQRPQKVWVLTNRKAIDLMLLIYPLMSPRRQEQITKVLCEWEGRRASTKRRLLDVS